MLEEFTSSGDTSSTPVFPSNAAAIDSNAANAAETSNNAAAPSRSVEMPVSADRETDLLAQKFVEDVRSFSRQQQESAERAQETQEEQQSESEVAPVVTTEEAVKAEDPFAEFETHFPTVEEINEAYSRVPIPARQEIAKWVDLAKAKSEAVDRVGGDESLEDYATLHTVISSPVVSDDNLVSFLQTIDSRNSALADRISQVLLKGAELEAIEAVGKGEESPYVQNIISALFGEDTSIEGLKELLSFERAGVLDREFLREELAENNGVVKNDPEKEAMKRKIAELEKANSLESKQKQATEQQRQQQFEDAAFKFSTERIGEHLKPLFDKLGWTGDDYKYRRGGCESFVENELRLQGYAANLEEMIYNGTAFAGGNYSKQFMLALKEIEKPAMKFALAYLKEHNNAAVSRVAHTRNAQLAKDQQEKIIPPVESGARESNGNKPYMSAEAEITLRTEEYLRALQQAGGV